MPIGLLCLPFLESQTIYTYTLLPVIKLKPHKGKNLQKKRIYCMKILWHEDKMIQELWGLYRNHKLAETAATPVN